MERFKGISPHRPLDDGPTKIRIVNLLPGEYGDPIECELEHIDMDTTKDYEALSYCWGEASITKPIFLDSKPYPVTINLFDALQRLRKSDGPRRLWIDSLCINQSDLVERSHEIGKMSAIYKEASQVLIWLGDFLPLSETAVRGIFNFIIEVSDSGKDENLGLEQLITRYGYQGLWQKQQRLNEFFRQRQWFERMWVLQEVIPRTTGIGVVTKESFPIFVCGSVQMPHYCLENYYHIWNTLPQECDPLAYLEIHPPLQIQVLISIFYASALEKREMSIAHQLGVYLDLGAATFRSTDPRDGIYALLGLLLGGTLPQHLLPNYEKSTSQVLTEFGKYLIEEHITVDIIQFRSGRSTGLPSWVPDWKHRPASAAAVLSDKAENNTFYEENGHWYLQVTFAQFDVIEQIGPIAGYQSKQDDAQEFVKEYIKALSGWLHDWAQKADLTFRQGIKPFGEKTQSNSRLVKELLLKYEFAMGKKKSTSWHQLLLDEDLSPYPAKKGTDRHATRASMHNAALGEPEPENGMDMEAGVTKLWQSMSSIIQDKSVFVCASGSIGILEQSNMQLEPGDVVGYIQGTCCELVLRSCSDSRFYEVIGQCHRSTQAETRHMTDLDFRGYGNGYNLRYHLEEALLRLPNQRVTLC